MGAIARILRTMAAAAALFAISCAAAAAAGKTQSVTFSFTGNSAIETSRLNDAAAAELGRAVDERLWRAAVDDAAFELESAYHSDGFAFAVVDYEIREEAGKKQVAFVIEEGPRVLLGDIVFEGNEFFSDEDLEVFFGRGHGGLSDQLLAVVTLGQAGNGGGEEPYVEEGVKKAVGSVRDLYYVKGFVEALVSDPEVVLAEDRTRADVTVAISEGPQHFVREVTFRGDLPPEVGERLAKLKEGLEGEVFQAARRTALRSRTEEVYRNAGYPDVKVDIVEGRGKEPGDVTLEAVITSGPRVMVTGIDIEGNRKTREKFIRNRILIEPGDWYSLRKQQQSALNLNRTGVFRSIEGSLEGEKGSGERRLLVRVEEAPSREVAIDLGWGSYEQARGQVAVVEKNFLGTGREVGAAAAGSLKGWSVRALVNDPWFLGTGISASAPISWGVREQPSYTEKKIEASAVFTRKLTRHLSGSLKYSLKFSDTVDIDTEEIDPDFRDNYNMGSLRLRFSHDDRDDFFYPTRGVQGSVSLEVADPVLLGDISFLRLTLTAGVFFPLGNDTVLALRWDTGYIYPTSEETTIPLPERFFNGGENNVRSFKEDQLGPKDREGDPTGGLAANVGTVELRRRLTGNLAGSLFVDAGNVAPNRSRVEQGLPPYEHLAEVVEDTAGDYFSGFRYGVGAGLQYLLPVGPLRVDVAMNPSPEEGEDKWVVHLTLGMAF